MGVISKAKLEIHTRPSKRLNVVQISWHCPLFGTCYLSKCGPRPCMPLHHILLKQAIIIGMLYLTSEVVNDHVSLWINYSKQAVFAELLQKISNNKQHHHSFTRP